MSKIKPETRSIIAIGKTGAGKSKLLNELLEEQQLFTSSLGITSCTINVKSSGWKKVKCKVNQTHEIAFELNAIDTPGIADSEGRSIKFLNDIAQTIKETPLNLIIILVQYDRLDTGLFSNLEVLRECLNDLCQSSAMLVINKVPTEKTLEKKRRKGEECRERKVLLDETFEKLSEALGNFFSFKFFLENDDTDDGETFNLKQYESIRQIIFSRSSFIKTSKVKTWDEIVKFYNDEISTDKEVQNQLNELIAEIEDKLEKVNFDIADIKYTFLENKDKMNKDLLSQDLENFIENFECHLTREKLNESKKYKRNFSESFQNGELFNNVLFELFDTGDEILNSMEVMWHCFYESIDAKLIKLGEKRNELLLELSKCQSSIEERDQMLQNKRTKIIRLKNALVNPNQIRT